MNTQPKGFAKGYALANAVIKSPDAVAKKFIAGVDMVSGFFSGIKHAVTEHRGEKK